MGRMAMILGALSLVLGVQGCKGQAQRDADEAAMSMRAAQAQGGGAAIHDQQPAEWDGQQMGQEGMGTDTTGGGPMEPTLLTVQIRAPYGEYLADSSGMSLYIFEADTPGEPSTCEGACAQAWPPLIADGGIGIGGELRVPAQVDTTLLGTAPRPDGQMQVTYNGMPLYTYAADESPGAIEGQGVDGFGARWYLMAPTGETIEDEKDPTAPDPADDARILEDADDVNELD